MVEKLIKTDWLFWIIFTLFLIPVGFFTLWLLGDERFALYGETAFIIWLIVYAGLKRAFYRFAIIILVSILIYFGINLFESREYKEGSKAFDKEQYEIAIQKLKVVLENEPDHYEAAYKLCVSQYKTENFKEALSSCNRAIKYGYPLENESHATRARIYKSLNEPNKAIRDFSRSLKSFTNWFVLFERCALYNQLKQYDKAIDDCKLALELNENLHEAWWSLGNAYYHKKDFNNALNAYLNYQKKSKEIPNFMRDRIIEMHGR